MARKLSALKINKIIEYKNAGYSQHFTATKLHINQTTVCHYWHKFDDYAKTEGLKAATVKYGGGDATEINSFMADMKKENLSLSDAKAGFKIFQLLNKLVVGPEGYENAIKACLKIDNEEGFLDTAAKLVELEEKLGKSGLDLISDLEEKANKIQGVKNELDQLCLLIKNNKKELDELEEKRQTATKEFENQMKYLGLNMHRLKLVEDLAQIFKKIGVSDESIETYLERQDVLDEAKLDIGSLASIVKQAKIVMVSDGGQALLSALKEYGSLTATNVSLGAKQKTLQESIVGLQAQAQLKGKLEGEVAILAVEKAALEPYLKKLQISKEQYLDLQAEIGEMVESGSKLVEQYEKSLQEKLELEKCIDELTEETKDLKLKAQKTIELNRRLAELEKLKKEHEDEWLSFQGFVALVREQPIEGLQLFSEVLPMLIESVKNGDYNAITVRNLTIKTITGTEFKMPMCYNCINKPANIESSELKNAQVPPFSVKMIKKGTGHA